MYMNKIIHDAHDAMGDVDGWAKAFVWSEGESVVARFESVTIVSLQTCVEGKILLTTHGLYFRQMGDEISIMSKKAIDPSVANGVASATGAGVNPGVGIGIVPVRGV